MIIPCQMAHGKFCFQWVIMRLIRDTWKYFTIVFLGLFPRTPVYTSCLYIYKLLYKIVIINVHSTLHSTFSTYWFYWSLLNSLHDLDNHDLLAVMNVRNCKNFSGHSNLFEPVHISYTSYREVRVQTSEWDNSNFEFCLNQLLGI